MDINKKDVNLLTKVEFNKSFAYQCKKRNRGSLPNVDRMTFLLTLMQKRILNLRKFMEFQ